MRTMRFFLAAGFLAFVGIAQPAVAQNPGAAAVQLPSGAYLIVVKEADSAPAGLVGELRLVFDTAGGYRVLQNNNELVVGKYTVQGNRLTLLDVSGQMACPDTQPAMYLWKLTDGSLVLEAVTDSCPGRRRMTTVRAMTRAKAY